jgi:nitrate reductase NapE component
MAANVAAVESEVRHLVLRKKSRTVGHDRKQFRCGLPSQHALLHAGEKKDNMLTLVIYVLTILLWAIAAVAVCGIALGFLARTIVGRPPYGNHSRPVAAAIRWERNWHR